MNMPELYTALPFYFALMFLVAPATD